MKHAPDVVSILSSSPEDLAESNSPNERNAKALMALANYFSFRHPAISEDICAVLAELGHLRQTLTWYADERNYQMNGVTHDKGSRARAALSKGPHKP
jgi:hypothetical protein